MKLVRALLGAVIGGAVIYAVGLAVNAWIVSFDLRIAWIVAAVAAVIWFLIYTLVLKPKSS